MLGWLAVCAAMAADAEIVHEGLTALSTQEVSDDEPYLLRVMFRLRLGGAARVWVDPTSGPATNRGANHAALIPAVFPDLQPFEVYGVWVVLMEQDSSDPGTVGGFAGALATTLRTRLDARLAREAVPADEALHVERLLTGMREVLYPMDTWGAILSLERGYFSRTFEDDDDFISDSWTFSLHAPPTIADRVEEIAFGPAGLAADGTGAGQKGWSESATDWFLPEAWDRSVPIDLVGSFTDYSMSVRRRDRRGPPPATPPEVPPPPAPGCAIRPQSVYAMPDHVRVTGRVATCDGVDHVAIPELAAALGYRVVRDGAVIQLVAADAEAGPAPVPPGHGELVAMGPWSEERTDAWAIQPLMVRRHASPYAFERRAEMEPLVAPAGHAVFSVEALVTNLGPDGAYARFTEADNALYGDERFGSIPLREVDALGPAWESGRLETQLPGQARPVRLLFTGPADYAPTGLHVRLGTAELGHRDVAWSLEEPGGEPPFVRPPRGTRPTIAEPATPRPTPTVPEEAPFDPTHNPPPGPGQGPRRGRR